MWTPLPLDTSPALHSIPRQGGLCLREAQVSSPVKPLFLGRKIMKNLGTHPGFVPEMLWKSGSILGKTNASKKFESWWSFTVMWAPSLWFLESQRVVLNSKPKADWPWSAAWDEMGSVIAGKQKFPVYFFTRWQESRNPLNRTGYFFFIRALAISLSPQTIPSSLHLKPLPLCLEELFLEAFLTAFSVSLSLSYPKEADIQ